MTNIPCFAVAGSGARGPVQSWILFIDYFIIKLEVESEENNGDWQLVSTIWILLTKIQYKSGGSLSRICYLADNFVKNLLNI